MIFDKLENAHLYAGLSEGIAKALEMLKDSSLSEKADGRYDVDGDKLYYMVLRYTTKPVEQGRLEAHKDYIDVQYMASGDEVLGYCPPEGLEVEEPYNEKNDVLFYKESAKVSMVNLDAGMFCILFPDDTHMPCLEVGKPADVCKVVFKVKINV